jgi:hypothetical protein
VSLLSHVILFIRRENRLVDRESTRWGDHVQHVDRRRRLFWEVVVLDVIHVSTFSPNVDQSDDGSTGISVGSATMHFHGSC